MRQPTSGPIYVLQGFQKGDRERKKQSAYWGKYDPNFSKSEEDNGQPNFGSQSNSSEEKPKRSTLRHIKNKL